MFIYYINKVFKTKYGLISRIKKHKFLLDITTERLLKGFANQTKGISNTWLCNKPAWTKLDHTE